MVVLPGDTTMAWFLHGLVLSIICSIIDNDYHVHVLLSVIIISSPPLLLRVRIISNSRGGMDPLASVWILRVSSDGE